MPSTLINHGDGNDGDDDTDHDGADDAIDHDDDHDDDIDDDGDHDGADDAIDHDDDDHDDIDDDGDAGENIDHNHNGGFPPWSPPVEVRTLSIAVSSNAIPLKWKWSSARRLKTQMLPIFTRSANSFHLSGLIMP